MTLSVHLVTGGKYIRAGDPLPEGIELPPHLEAFVVDPPQSSRAASQAEGVRLSGGSQLANSAVENSLQREASYREGEEEFAPKWKLKRKKRRDEF